MTTTTVQNWPELAASSPYQTALAVNEALRHGDVLNARNGIEELIEALARSDKRALRSHLQRLMLHVIKWQAQPKKRSRSWRTSIRHARREIAGVQEDTPSMTRAVIESMWQDCFEAAKEAAEDEMKAESPISELGWDDVFVTDYVPEESKKKRK